MTTPRSCLRRALLRRRGMPLALGRLRLPAAPGAGLRLQVDRRARQVRAYVTLRCARNSAPPARSECCPRRRTRRRGDPRHPGRDPRAAPWCRPTRPARCASCSCACACAIRLRTPDGKELLGPIAIEQTRDITYNETAALAKEGEDRAAVPRHADRHRPADPAPARGRQASLLMQLAAGPARRAPAKGAEAALHHPRRRAAAGAGGGRRDPRGGARAGLHRAQQLHRGRRAFRLERGAGGRRLAEPVRRPADRRDPHSLGQAGQGRQRRAAADRRGRARATTAP